MRADRKRLLLGDSVTYDVIWDDGACTRGLSLAELRRPQWVALAEMRSIEACNEIWYSFLLKQVRARGQQASDGPSCAHAVRAVPPTRRANCSGDANGTAVTAPLTAREISARARTLLARYGLEQVAVDTCRRVAGNVLQVAWMDGPVDATMYGVLAELQRCGHISRIDLARSASTQTLQACIDYIHETFYAAVDLQRPGAQLQRVLSVTTPDAYQRRDLTAVTAPHGHANSSLAYQTLIRCVFERWDDLRKRFCDTATWRHARSELHALFPDGDQAASARMANLLDQLRAAQEPDDEKLVIEADASPRG